MDFTGRPSDVLITLEERNEGSVDLIGCGPGSQADLNRGIGSALGSAGGFEVDGGESCLANLDREELAEVVGNENPDCRLYLTAQSQR